MSWHHCGSAPGPQGSCMIWFPEESRGGCGERRDQHEWRTDVTAQGRGKYCSGRLAWPESRDESKRGWRVPSGPLQETLSSPGTLGSKKQFPQVTTTEGGVLPWLPWPLLLPSPLTLASHSSRSALHLLPASCASSDPSWLRGWRPALDQPPRQQDSGASPLSLSGLPAQTQP